MTKWYVWRDGDRIAECDDYEEALMVANELDADEIEETTWDSYEDYREYQPADSFKTVWHR